MREKNPALDWGYKELRKAVFDDAAKGKREITEIKMPRTKSGNHRFPSRSDGAEAGIVENGIKTRLV